MTDEEQRQVARTMGALVLAAGGKLHITPEVLCDVITYTLTQKTDLVSGDIIFSMEMTK